MRDPLSTLLTAAAKRTDDDRVRAWLLALAGSEATYASSDGFNAQPIPGATAEANGRGTDVKANSE